MMVKIEKRRYERNPVNYIVELWIMKDADYKDVGFRGSVKDFCPGGLCIDDLNNINVKGLDIEYTLKKDFPVRLIIYVPGKTLSLSGTVAWVSMESSNKSLGINFTDITDDAVEFISMDIKKNEKDLRLESVLRG